MLTPETRPRQGASRFAPTPTGHLHLGNARTALLAWLAGRALGLRNVLRVEDLDPKAIPAGCLEGQYSDLDWLGLRYDEGPRVGGPAGPYRQSERFERYDAVLKRLDALGVLYPCWCSRKEIQMAAVAPHASDEGPVYPGTCRPTTSEVLGDFDALPTRRGRRPAIRVDIARALAHLESQSITFTDLIAGPQSDSLTASMGDFVVRRVDGVAAYQIACSWDDVAMNCTLVLRGRDLLPSTARQVLILSLLGETLPEYAHPGLVMDSHGERLSKRDGSISLRELRERGVAPSAVVAYLARLSGLPDSGDLDHLTNAFNMSTLTPSDVRHTGRF